MIAETIPEIGELDDSEKLLLISELWDSMISGKVDVPVSKSLLDELDRRMEEYRKDPSKAVTWEEAEARIRASRA